MFRFFVYLFFLLLPAFTVHGQLQIAVDFQKTKFIQHEPIDMTLQVVNNSGTQLIFGKNKGGIELLILNELNNFLTIVNPINEDFNPAEGLVLGAGETKNISIRINKHFPMSRDVKYRIRAKIWHKRLQNAIQTKKHFEIQVDKGHLISTHTFGVTDLNNPKNVQTRKYSLLGFNVDNSDMYCIKIFDDKWVYALHRLGPKVSGIEPRHELDPFSNIHILIQLKPSVFMHVVFSPEGKKQQEIIYRASFDNVPYLERDSDLGKITVRNGLKAREGVDYVKQGDIYQVLTR